MKLDPHLQDELYQLGIVMLCVLVVLICVVYAGSRVLP